MQQNLVVEEEEKLKSHHFVEPHLEYFVDGFEFSISYSSGNMNVLAAYAGTNRYLQILSDTEPRRSRILHLCLVELDETRVQVGKCFATIWCAI